MGEPQRRDRDGRRGARPGERRRGGHERVRRLGGRPARGRERDAGRLRRAVGLRPRQGLDVAPDVRAGGCPERRLDARRPRGLRHAAPESKVEPLAGRGRRREPARAPDRGRRHPEPQSRFAGRPLRAPRARRGHEGRPVAAPARPLGSRHRLAGGGRQPGLRRELLAGRPLPGVRVGRDGPLRSLRAAIPRRRGAMAGVDGRRAAAGLVARGRDLLQVARADDVRGGFGARWRARGGDATPALRGAGRRGTVDRFQAVGRRPALPDVALAAGRARDARAQLAERARSARGRRAGDSPGSGGCGVWALHTPRTRKGATAS